MRQIERQMIQAITNRQTWSNNNTRVVLWSGSPITTDPNHNKEEMRVYLHGHHIASYNTKDMSLKVNNCGYKTNTTKSRLNALIDFVKGSDPVQNGIFQKDWRWWLISDGEILDFPTNKWITA